MGKLTQISRATWTLAVVAVAGCHGASQDRATSWDQPADSITDGAPEYPPQPVTESNARSNRHANAKDAQKAVAAALIASRRHSFRTDVAQPELRMELLAMSAKDQQLRMALLSGSGTPSKEAMPQIADVDAQNTARMHEIIDQYGWPTRSMVGDDGASAAWLLVQHADRDNSFQRRCLDLMKPLVDGGEISAVNVAYLTDRVRIHEGKPQVYGTQFHESNGNWEPYPIEDRDRVDERRAALGLSTLAEYKRIFMSFQDTSD